jgi:hypothetical protein
MSDESPIRLGCWISADAESFAASLAASDALERVACCHVDAVGGERRTAAGAWAVRFGADEVASLRELAAREPDLALVLGAGWGRDDLRHLLERSRRVVVSVAPSLEDAISLGERIERLTVAPTTTTSGGFRAVATVVTELARLPADEDASPESPAARNERGVRSVAIRFRTPAGPRGLEPLLVDACDLVTWSFGPFAPIELVMAMSRSPRGAGDLQSVGMLARDAFDRVATIDLAESGHAGRDVEWQLAEGRVVLDDRGVRSWDASGSQLDSGDSVGPIPLDDGLGGLIGALRDDIDARTGTRLLRTLALLEATKLSLRTGNPESPQRLLDLVARP